MCQSLRSQHSLTDSEILNGGRIRGTTIIAINLLHQLAHLFKILNVSVKTRHVHISRYTSCTKGLQFIQLCTKFIILNVGIIYALDFIFQTFIIGSVRTSIRLLLCSSQTFLRLTECIGIITKGTDILNTLLNKYVILHIGRSHAFQQIQLTLQLATCISENSHITSWGSRTATDSGIQLTHLRLSTLYFLLNIFLSLNSRFSLFLLCLCVGFHLRLLPTLNILLIFLFLPCSFFLRLVGKTLYLFIIFLLCLDALPCESVQVSNHLLRVFKRMGIVRIDDRSVAVTSGKKLLIRHGSKDFLLDSVQSVNLLCNGFRHIFVSILRSIAPRSHNALNGILNVIESSFKTSGIPLLDRSIGISQRHILYQLPCGGRSISNAMLQLIVVSIEHSNVIGSTGQRQLQ